MIRAAEYQVDLPSNSPIRRQTTMPSPAPTLGLVVDPYGPESTDYETLFPPPASVPQDIRESGTVPVTRDERSDLVGENIRLRMLLARVANARVCDLPMICEDIRDELGEAW